MEGLGCRQESLWLWLSLERHANVHSVPDVVDVDDPLDGRVDLRDELELMQHLAHQRSVAEYRGNGGTVQDYALEHSHPRRSHPLPGDRSAQALAAMQRDDADEQQR